MKSVPYAIQTLLLLVFPTLAFCENGSAGTVRGASQPVSLVRVLSKVFQDNLKEMQIGQIAIERGVSEGVRRFGDRLFRDHRMANLRVIEISEEEGMQLESWIPESSQEVLDFQEGLSLVSELQSIPQEAFDEEFLGAMIRMHRKTIQTLSDAIEGMDEGSARTFLVTMVPVLRQHLQLAMLLQEREGKL